MEFGALIAKALFASAEGAKVLDGLGDNVVEEVEVDTPGLGCFVDGSAFVDDGGDGNGQDGSCGLPGWKTTLTLGSTSGGDVSPAVDLNLGPSPSTIEKYLLNHGGG